jgi:hypothetical protein
VSGRGGGRGFFIRHLFLFPWVFIFTIQAALQSLQLTKDLVKECLIIPQLLPCIDIVIQPDKRLKDLCNAVNHDEGESCSSEVPLEVPEGGREEDGCEGDKEVCVAAHLPTRTLANHIAKTATHQVHELATEGGKGLQDTVKINESDVEGGVKGNPKELLRQLSPHTSWKRTQDFLECREECVGRECISWEWSAFLNPLEKLSDVL